MSIKKFSLTLLMYGVVAGILFSIAYVMFIGSGLSWALFFTGFFIGLGYGLYKYFIPFRNQLYVDREVKKIELEFYKDLDRTLGLYEGGDFTKYTEYDKKDSAEVFMTNTEAEYAYSGCLVDAYGLEEFLERASGYRYLGLLPDSAYLFNCLRNLNWMTQELFDDITDTDRLNRELRTIREGYDDLLNRHNTLKIGNSGERIVLSELRKYGDRFTVLDGIRFSTSEAVVGQELDGKTVENDVLVFTNNGLYTLEIKNIMSEGEKYLRISKDGVWYKKTREDGSWKADPNTTKIFSQVNRQVHYTESLIERKLGKKISLTSVIVIANDNVQIENETDWLIVRPNMLFSLLNGRDVSDVTLTDSEIEELVNMFKTYDLGAGKFPAIDYSSDVKKWIKNAKAIDCIMAFRSDINSTFNYSDAKLSRL